MFGRRRHGRQGQAVIARAEAAVAFSTMEELQRQLYDRLTFAAHVDGGPRGQALIDRIRVASLPADEAVARWLALGGEGEGDGAAAPAPADEAIAEAYSVVRDQLTQARGALERLLTEVGPELSAIEQALAAVPRRVQEAHQAMRGAHDAVEALRLDGLAPEAAEQALILVQRRAEVLDEGPAVHGIAAILAAADEVIELAAEARRRAEEFPHQRDDIARRLVSMRSRLEATEGRGYRLERGLAALRRGYVEASWLDLEQVPALFQAALEEAEDDLEQAQSSSRRLAYPSALRLLERTRVALTRADEHVHLVTQRLAQLDALQADPGAPALPVQFALDDAKLVCESVAAPERVQRLGELQVRVKTAPALIAGDEPDYYGYLVELEAINAEIAAVIIDVRRG